MDRTSGEASASYSARTHFGNAKNFPAANHRSSINKDKIASFIDKYDIPTGAWFVYRPSEEDRIYYTPPVPKGYGDHAIGISEAAFFCGFRVPLLPLVKHLFAEMDIAIGQMDPNGFIHMNTFQYRCLKAGVEPSTQLFWYHYDFRKNPKSKGDRKSVV